MGLFSFWCGECALVGKYFGKYSGIKHLIWISGQDARKDNRYVYFIRPKAGDLVAKSDFLSKEFFKNYNILPRFIVPNGVDPGQFAPQPVKRDIHISGAGSLINLKQYDIFIEIIRALKLQIPAIQTIICGKGPEEQNLQLQIEQWGLGNNISLAGEKSHPEVLQVMQRSRVFLHPSCYEGSSSVCIEALYAGAHVISFWSPGTIAIKHWHIVSNKDDMVTKALEILFSPGTDHEPVLVHSMNDSAKAVMELFGLP